MSRKKIRVLLVTKLYFPWIGGIERHVENIAKGLGDEFDIRVLCCQEPSSGISGWQEIEGVRVFKALSWGMILSMPVSFSFAGHLKRLAMESDVIHYHLPFPLAAVAHWLVRPKVPFVVTWHSDVIRQKKIDFLLSYWTHWFLQRAKTIIATSSRLVDSSMRLQNYREKIQVVPLALSVDSFAPSSGMIERVGQIRGDFRGCWALFVGRFVPYKGLSYLIEAMVQVEKSVKLLLIGSGPLENELRLLAQKLNVQDRVVFLGEHPPHQLLTYYYACDFFVLPSITSNEAFGIVQMEAMACSKPVINTFLPTGVPEVSLHEQSGLTVEPGNSRVLAEAINRLANDESLRLRLGAQGFKRVREVFDEPVVFPKIEKIYRESVLF